MDSIELSDLDNYETPEWIQFQLSIPNFADQPAGQENRLTFRPVLFPMEMSRSYAALPRREHELVLRYNWSRIRKIEVTIPDGFKVIQLPENQEESTLFGSIKQQSRVVDDKIIVEHEVRLQVDDLRIPTSQYEAFRNFCAEVDRAEEQQVILERK